MKLIFDMEADNLMPDVTQCWCVVTKDLYYDNVDGEDGICEFDPRHLNEALDQLSAADTLIGHNIIGYDLPVFKKLYGWEPTPKTKLIDTYVLSRLLNPDRNAHSIEWWGGVFRREKPIHEDWSQFSEDMLHRCKEDVEINYLVYKYLMKEWRDLVA